MSDSKVAEDTPCIDTGSFIKIYLNPFYTWRLDAHKGEEGEPAFVVGSGKYDGDDKKSFVDSSSAKLVYLSYRNCFPKLPNGSTTDSYWGCLVRTAQMVLGQAFMRHYGGGCSVIPEDAMENLRTRVKPLFRDSASAPFSLHQIEYAAHDQGIKYARWLSPTQACKAAFDACERYYQSGKPCPFPICCEDRNINKAQAYEILRRGEPILFLVPVVMGIKKLNQKYQRMLLRCLEMEHCCGIAGGHGKASIYFFGHQGSSVYYLDPHYVQPAYLSPDTEGKTTHIRGSIKIAKIDPCMFIGYYIADESGFERFLVELKEMNSFVPFPLISVSEGDPRDKASAALNVPPDRVDEVQADRIIAVGDDGTFSPVARDVQVPEYPTEASPAEEEHAGQEVNPLARGATEDTAEVPDAVPQREVAGEVPQTSASAMRDMPSTYPTEEEEDDVREGSGRGENPLLPRSGTPSGSQRKSQRASVDGHNGSNTEEATVVRKSSSRSVNREDEVRAGHQYLTEDEAGGEVRGMYPVETEGSLPPNG